MNAYHVLLVAILACSALTAELNHVHDPKHVVSIEAKKRFLKNAIPLQAKKAMVKQALKNVIANKIAKEISIKSHDEISDEDMEHWAGDLAKAGAGIVSSFGW